MADQRGSGRAGHVRAGRDALGGRHPVDRAGPRAHRDRTALRGAALRRRPGPARARRPAAGTGCRGGRDHRPLRGQLAGLPGRRAHDPAGRRAHALPLGHRGCEARPHRAARPAARGGSGPRPGAGGRRPPGVGVAGLPPAGAADVPGPRRVRARPLPGRRRPAQPRRDRRRDPGTGDRPAVRPAAAAAQPAGRPGPRDQRLDGRPRPRGHLGRSPPPARPDRRDPATAPVTAAVEAPDGVWSQVVGQPAVVEELRAAVTDPAAMTHAWLFTGPPGSGRSVAARAFAAALQCPDGGDGTCHACRTVLAGTHADVKVIVPDGLSIGVLEARELVRVAGRSPSQGRWQMIIVEDADRMSEAAANAVLKMIEEPPPRTVVMLCAPSLHPDDVPVTIRSRCRVVALRTPPVDAVAEVLARQDGVDPALAAWSAAASGGHVGRARRLARDEDARLTRKAVLDVPLSLVSLAACLDAADDPVGAAEEETEAATSVLDAAETEAVKAALGYGARGPGMAAAAKGAGALKELERRQKSRATRLGRDSFDRALVDLAGLYRDALVLDAAGEDPPQLLHPDRRADAAELSRRIGAEGALRRIDAVLACRLALEQNVKPRIALEALTVALRLPV